MNGGEPQPAVRQHERRRYQYSLRVLLLLPLVCAIPCSWVACRVQRAARQKAAVRGIVETGGSVTYDYEAEARSHHWPSKPEPPGPPWLRALLGEDFFSRVIYL